MKTIYIPKGETIRYESLATEHLVVHGCLQVTCGITAKTITGYGTVHAGTVNADVIRVDDMDAGSIVCSRRRSLPRRAPRYPAFYPLPM